MSNLKTSRPKTYKLVVLFFMILFLSYAKNVLAEVAVVIADFDNEVNVQEEFNINISATGLENEKNYYYKCRLGKTDQLNKAETNNSSSGVWLGDTDAWTGFPIVQSNPGGNLTADFKCRSKSTIETGQNLLHVRIRPVDGNSNFDSSVIEITVFSVPVFTPTVVLTPSSTPTFSPTPTQNVPTIVPTVTLTSTPIPNSYSSIDLSEYLPDPDSGNEKVEIKNNNNFSVRLINWQIDDIGNGGHLPKVFTAEISAGGLYTIDLGTSSFLNNEGDAVRLLDFNGVQKDRRDFDRSSKNLSWQRDDGGNWCEKNSSFDAGNNDCGIVSPTPTAVASTPTIKFTPTQSPITTPTVVSETSLVPTPQIVVMSKQTQENKGEILGSEVFKDESRDEDLFPENYPAGYNVKSKITKYLFLIPIIVGIIIILIAGGSLYKSQVRKRSVL